MAIPVKIVGDGYDANVTPIGQVVVGAYSYDEVMFNELAEPDTGYNFFNPKTHQQFVITGIIAKADKQVSGTVDADVVIYETTTTAETTVDKVLLQLTMVEGDLIQIPALNIKVNAGKFINAKTTDDDIHMTITGYYIPELIDSNGV